MAIPPTSALDEEAKLHLTLGALIAAGPTLWFVDLVLAYAISNHECGGDWATASLSLTLAAALGTIAVLVTTARLRKRQQDVAGARARQQAFLFQLAFALNAMALILLVGFVAPLAYLRPCE